MNATEYVVTVHYRTRGTKVYRFATFGKAMHGLEVAATLGLSVEFRTEEREV